MDNFYSREITLADMPFLMHEFEEGTLTPKLVCSVQWADIADTSKLAIKYELSKSSALGVPSKSYENRQNHQKGGFVVPGIKELLQNVAVSQLLRAS